MPETTESEPRRAITVRLPEKLIEELDAYCERQRFPPARNTVIELLLVELLEAERAKAVEPK